MMRTSTHGDSSAPAAVEYTSSVIGFKGLGFDRMRRAKLVDPDGRPFDLYWATASIGSFRVSLYDSEFLGSRRDRVGAKRLIAVSAAGYGPAFFDLLEGAPLEKRRTFHLPKDDVPIRGRIISPTGQPLAGVKVTPRSLLYVETPDRKPLPLEDVAPIFEGEVRPRHVMRTGPEIASLLPSTTTDAAGRFEIRGIGRDRVVRLLISGQEVESHWMSVATRSAPVEIRNDTSTFRLFADYPEDPERSLWAGSLGFSTLWLGAESEVDEVIPASFMQTLRPSRPIIGVVLDDRSGKPISHVNVFCEPPRPKWLLNPKVAQPGGAATVVTTTNEQGEFQLSGVPKRTNVILAEPPESLPYFNRGVLCDTGGDGVEPVKLVIRLARGIPVRGRLLNEKGKPFAGRISYFPLGKNAIVGAYADSVSVGRTGGPMQPQYPETQAGADGRFWIPVLPGPGVLLADSHHEGSRRIHFDRPEDADFANFATSLIESDPTIVPTHLWPRSLNPYDAYKGIDVPADVESVQVDMQVNVGHAVEGRVVDPMGQPPAGVLAYGTSHDRLASDGRFDTRGLVPGKPRMLYFLQPEKGLGGFCRVEDGEAGPITVRLDPTGSVRGVLTDANGKPMARTRLYLAYAEADGVPRVIFPGGWRIPTDVEVERARWMGGAAPPVEHRWEVTDENGAFLVRGVIPDLAFQLFASTSQYSTDPLAVTRVLPNRHLDLGTLKLPVVR
jgi:hypothetical protein